MAAITHTTIGAARRWCMALAGAWLWAAWGMAPLGAQPPTVQLTGVVQGVEGEPLAYANVFLDSTSQGVLSNARGAFVLNLAPGAYTLVVQAMGHEPVRLPVALRRDTALVVRMAAGMMQTETVEIRATGEDPAYGIMAQVIAHKAQHQGQFSSFQRETYLKVTLEADTTARKPKKVREGKAEADSTAAPQGRPAPQAPKAAAAQAAQAAKRKRNTPEADSAGAALPPPPSPADSTAAPADSSRKHRIDFVEAVFTKYAEVGGRSKSVVHAYRDLAKHSGGGPQVSVSFGGGGDALGGADQQQLNPYVFYPDAPGDLFAFYDNTFMVGAISDRPLVSPLHSLLWRLSYRYRLEATLREAGQVVYKIHITPRPDVGPYFEGDLYVSEGDWAIKSLNLRLHPSVLLYHTAFHLLHRYAPLPDGRHVLTQEDYYYETKDGRDRLYGNSIALHSAYAVDVAFPKGFFGQEVKRTEDSAYVRGLDYWQSVRPIALRQEEAKYIEVQDSIRAYHKSPVYLAKMDSQFNRFEWEKLFLQGLTFRDRGRGMSYYLNPVISMVRPLGAGLGDIRIAQGGNVTKTFKRAYELTLSGELSVGILNGDPRGNGRLRYTFLPKRFGGAYVGYENDYAMVNQAATIVGLFSRNNFVNRIGYRAGVFIEAVNGLYVDVDGYFADYRSIDSLRVREWSNALFGDANVPASFEPFRQFLIDVKLRYVPGQPFEITPYRKLVRPSRWPTLGLHWTQSVPGVGGSELDFIRVVLSAKHLVRWPGLGEAQWAVYAGRFLRTRNLRFTDYSFFRGSDPFLMAPPLNYLQLLGETRTTTNEYLQAHYIHEFGRSLIDRVPLLNRLPITLTGGGGLLAMRDGGFFHAEVYGGLLWPFRIRSQRMRVGVYYATAYSTLANSIRFQPKVGFSFYDSGAQRWNYGE